MLRGILDPNVLVSAMLYGGVPQQVLEQAEVGQYRLILSKNLLEEIVKVLHYPKFRSFRLTDAEIEDFALHLLQVGVVTNRLTSVPIFEPDPKDTHLLALAVTARADYLVTGDTKLRDLGAYGGTQIVTPRQFLEL